MTEQTHYQLLGVDPGANRNGIRAAYRKALRRYHPDANAGNREGEQMLRRVITAGRILCNSQQRATYDEQLTRQVEQQRPSSPVAKSQPALCNRNPLMLLCQKIIHSSQWACKHFFGTEQAAATETRAAHQRQRDDLGFNVYLYREMNRNRPRRYQRGPDGICRKVTPTSRKERSKNWREKLSPDC